MTDTTSDPAVSAGASGSGARSSSFQPPGSSCSSSIEQMRGEMLSSMTPVATRLATPATLVLLVALAGAMCEAAAQDPQISEGVRVMAAVGKMRFGPQRHAYMVSRQPPIYAYMPPETTRFFDAEADVVSFFQSFPDAVQRRGLWVTRAGVASEDTKEDRARVSMLVDEARRRKVLMYVCMPEGRGDSELVSWICSRESPRSSREVLACLPRKEPHLGHPWWDCAQSGGAASVVPPASANSRVYQWTEDVQLSDGRTLVVRRTVEYEGSADLRGGRDLSWLQTKAGISVVEPSDGKREVSFTGSLIPLVLGVLPDRSVYLVW